MHRIRDAQWRAFRDTARDEFVERMHAHLQQHFPAQVAAMGRAAVLEHIRRAIEVARTFDLVSRRDVCKYLNLTMVHGLLFHRDPERAWMLAMLRDPEVPDPRERLARLYAEAVRRLAIDAKNARIREEFGL